MKSSIVISVVALACISGEAIGACESASNITGAALGTLLTNNTVCVPPNGPSFEAQEQHFSGGVLKDYKMGPSDPVDPTTQVGTWSQNGSTVTYNYGGGTIFTYTVHDNLDGTHSFCTGVGGTVVTVGKFKPGLTNCP